MNAQEARMTPQTNLYALNGCCGVKELHGISYIKEENFLFELRHITKKFLIQAKGAFILFSQASAPGYPASTYGEKFRDLLLTNGLGEVWETGPRINPNSTNLLKVWLWAPNVEALKKFTSVEVPAPAAPGPSAPAPVRS